MITSFYESNGRKMLCQNPLVSYYLGKFIDDLDTYFEYEDNV